MENRYFPIFYNITGWNICFIGAGTVAQRRIRALLKYSCHIFVVSKELSDNIKKMKQKGSIVWIPEEIGKSDGKKEFSEIYEKIVNQYSSYFSEKKEFSMIFACTNKRKVNQEIYDYCKNRNILVNVADCERQSDFYFPGLLEWEDVIIGVTGNGKNHKKVKAVMDKLRDIFRINNE